MGNLKVIHLFSGVGAPEMALKKLGVPIEIVGFSEIDKYAIKSYKAIHGEDKQNLGDIKEIERLPQCNLLVYGSPCQDFSIAGLQKGLVDKEGNQTRSGLLFEVERLLEVAKQNNELPEVLLMENVKNLVSKKFKPDFDRWLNKLDELGYNCYWQVLNAKDYGIPQNRERVFVVSIRKDVDEGYIFPEKMPLTIRLKDVLEEVVDEKYYLSNDKISKILDWKAQQKPFEKVLGNNSISSCLTARGAGEYHSGMIIYCDKFQETKNIHNDLITAERLGGLFDEENSKHQAGSIWDKEQLSPTLDTMQGGYRQPLIIDEPKINKIDIPQTVRVRKYEVDIEKLKVLLKEHKKYTNKEIANKLNVPQTKVEHWFRSDNCFAIPDAEYWYKLKDLLDIKTDEFDAAITTFEEKEGTFEKSNRCYLDTGISPTLTATSADEKVITNLRIRKLTPKECWRLMGFSDQDFELARAAAISDTQLYKQAGNSIVVDVLYYIFKGLFK